MRRVRSPLAVLTLLLVPLASSARAQATGILAGTVHDEQGTPLPGTTITVRGDGAPKVQVTDAQGRFRFLGLGAGNVEVEAERDGLTTTLYPSVAITPGGTTELAITLGAARPLTVSSGLPVFYGNRLGAGGTVVLTEIEKIPTARDPWAILAQTPSAFADRIEFSDPLVEGKGVRTGGPLFVEEVADLGDGNSGILSVRDSDPPRILFDFCGPGCVDSWGQNLGIGVDPDFLLYGPDRGLLARVVEAPSGGSQINVQSVTFDGSRLHLAPRHLLDAPPDRFNVEPRLLGYPGATTFFTAFTSCGDPFLTDCPELFLHPLTPDLVTQPGASLTASPGSSFLPFATDLAGTPDGHLLLKFSLLTDDAQVLTGGAIFAPGLQPLGTPQFLYSGSDSIFGRSDSITLLDPGTFFVVDTRLSSGGTQEIVGRAIDPSAPIVPADPFVFEIQLPPTDAGGSNLVSPYFAGQALLTFDFVAPKAGAAAALPAGVYHQRVRVEQPCVPSATTLCLNRGRFQVDVTYATAQGAVGQGAGVLLSGDTGYFTFFDPANVELMVKVIDGCGLGGRYWVFAGGLTNVETILDVTDMRTGERVRFVNPQGQAYQPYQNTSAFPCAVADSDAAAAIAGGNAVGEWTVGAPATESAAAADVTEATAPATVSSSDTTPCAADATHLCLRGGRFEVTARWRTKAGASGDARAVPLALAGGAASDTGYFWFFDEQNAEMVVKVIDGCALGGHYWVFAGGLTNLRVTTTVRDTATGVVRTYVNPQGKAFLPLQDTGAFACG